MFATGRHPSYPGVRMDGSDGITDLRMSIPQSTGAFIRCVFHMQVDIVSMASSCFTVSLSSQSCQACRRPSVDFPHLCHTYVLPMKGDRSVHG
jgi:hypothetical protein